MKFSINYSINFYLIIILNFPKKNKTRKNLTILLLIENQ